MCTSNLLDMSHEVWNLEKDLCRCCHSEGSFKSLYTPYFGLNAEQVYGNLLRECLDIELVAAETTQASAICDSCIGRLQDAVQFKQQVYNCEVQFRLRSSKISDTGSNDNFLKNNNYSTNGNDENNFEYDSDTPISRLSKEYGDNKDKFTVENDISNLDILNESVKAPQYKLLGVVKPVSERKRIKVTCETVLTNTTACPFRHHRSWFRCFYCTQDFMDVDKLRQHTLQNHNAEDVLNLKRYPRSLQIDISDFECKLCNETLKDVQDMVDHFLRQHDKVVYKECIADYKVNTSPYTCHLCRKQYHVFRTLTTHLNEHYANYICDVCGKPFLNKKRLKVHKRTHECGNFPCTECGKVLKTKTSKANHMESHSKRILKCHLCSKPMKHYNERIKHMSEVHDITHKFKCVICGREYNVKHYLATHMRQTHGHKNKKCLECGMAFITNHVLKKHMLKHTGEKRFSCTVCSKAYARSYSLKEHMRGHETEKVDQ